MRTRSSHRAALLCAVSSFGIAASPTLAAVPAGHSPTPTEQIVANHTVNPLGPASVLPGINSPAAQAASVYSNSPQVLDPAGSINGIGQQIAFIQTGATTAGLSLCSGSLINPRTVITAAHCVYNNPAHFYGSNTGTGGGVNGNFGTGGAPLNSQGIPYSFGFESLNRNCFNAGGLPFTCPAGQKGPYETWRDANFQTVVSRHIYNANQVWYNRNAQPVALGGGGEFAHGDIALITLDTHAKGVPTWTMLFSPLDGPTHATVTGYGGAGVGLSGMGNVAGIDYRRRSAENMIDALMTNNDWVDSPAINPGNTAFAAHQHSIYWLDFDDPDHDPDNLPANFFTNTAPPGSRNNGYYDFNGLGGTTLPNEGATAGGDSGGPLVIDQRWDTKVIAGVLTGSWSFNGGISTYGQFNVYPPLFQFWEEIVQNNPYKYVSALEGDGDWFDPAHWVQDMDPGYVTIDANGDLVNVLPDNPQGGGDGAVDKFGTLCFLETDCKTFSGPGAPAGDGIPHLTAGGPGSTNFVPNNVEPVNSANAANHVLARYYDVTLREAGTTTLSQAATIDVMTIEGPAKLKIAAGGTLNTWADYTQAGGWTQVDGTLNTSEMIVATGLLSGNGTINPDFLTVVAGHVAPGGGDALGTLTVNSDMILASGSSLFVDANRNGADLLDVAGVLTLNGGSVVFNKPTDTAAPRQGQVFTIANADLGVSGTFAAAFTFQGVLRPVVTYTANTVRAVFKPGSLVEILDGGSAIEIAFADALDQLRSSSYAQLWNLYGSIDWMNASQLASALSALTPKIVGDVGAFHEHQSKLLMSPITDRLSMLGTGNAKGLTISGSPMMALAAGNSSSDMQMRFGDGARNVVLDTLPGGITGFVSGGIERTRSSYGGNYAAGQGGWHMAMGLEMPLGDGRIGTAAGYAEGETGPGGDSNRSRTSMAAAYAAMPLGSGVYVGGLVSTESSRAAVERGSHDGVSLLRLSGATSAVRYSAVAELGRLTDIGAGLSLTPRAQLSYSHYKLGGFTERGGETALRIDDLKLNRVEARLGAKLEGRTSIGGLTVTPRISADYVSLLSGRTIDATVRFDAAPGEAFELPLGNSASGWAEIKGGVSIGDGPVTLDLTGQHAVGVSSLSDDRAQAELKFRF